MPVMRGLPRRSCRPARHCGGLAGPWRAREGLPTGGASPSRCPLSRRSRARGCCRVPLPPPRCRLLTHAPDVWCLDARAGGAASCVFPGRRESAVSGRGCSWGRAPRQGGGWRSGSGGRGRAGAGEGCRRELGRGASSGAGSPRAGAATRPEGGTVRGELETWRPGPGRCCVERGGSATKACGACWRTGPATGVREGSECSSLCTRITQQQPEEAWTR